MLRKTLQGVARFEQSTIFAMAFDWQETSSQGVSVSLLVIEVQKKIGPVDNIFLVFCIVFRGLLLVGPKQKFRGRRS